MAVTMEKKIILPEDMIEEILSRVPAKPLSRFRSTSKQWHALLKSESFAKKHSANAPKEEPLIIMLLHSRVYLMKIDRHGIHNNVASSVKVGAQLHLQDRLCDTSREVDIRNVFHCNGLLLCATKDNRLVVWNPCSGETHWAKPRDSYKKTDFYALGYDKSKRYKILRVNRLFSYHPQVQNEYEVYDFTSDSWRVLGFTDWYLPSDRPGVSVKGVTNWVALNINITQEEGFFLLCFDFSTERFQSLSLPHPFPYDVSGLSVVGEEKLFLFGTLHHVDGADSKDIHVWVRSSTGSSVMAWSKFLIVRNSYSFSEVSFLADEQNKIVVCCDKYSFPVKDLHIVGENKYIRVDHNGGQLYRQGRAYCSDLQNYIPNLTHIQQGRGRKRKAPEVEQKRDL